MADIGKKDEFHLVHLFQFLFFEALQFDFILIVGANQGNLANQPKHAQKSDEIQRVCPGRTPPGRKYPHRKLSHTRIPDAIAIGRFDQKLVLARWQIGVVRQSFGGIRVNPIGVKTLQFVGKSVLLRASIMQS